ncbi:gamma-glutamylcyclotransferase [Rhizobium sp. L1K21]|uniref:gamma-glutamylcyclotransferase n=1 Tax=Rhizobium sp. L1K21 TaxID=2954933 RepID=UPI002093F771|nr:gamma-glutamylcyclotransferase [Rhizobium sp. L1K21]MCO6188165.1 gamma-glutamylcyclotransferase [Rhizobium sp. L1K21]
MAQEMEDFWVFGYGSLMWRPDFPFEERQLARAFGYHRALCIRSWVHRGTQDKPGLVLGLDRGGSCRGVAFRVAPAHREAVLDYLRERELVTNVYMERIVPTLLADRRRVQAVTFVADRSHEQYARKIDAEEAAIIAASAVGQSGPNDVYVRNTVQHLREIGIRDGWLEQVVRRMEEIKLPA